MFKEKIRDFVLTKRNLIFFSVFNTFLLWQLSYFIFILWDEKIFFDSNSYILMAKGNFNVIEHHGYRIALPIIASVLSNFLSALRIEDMAYYLISNELNIRLSFYILNLSISFLIFYFLYESLKSMRYGVDIVLITIACFQLNSTYLFHIAIPNVDIAVILFVSMGFYLYCKKHNFKSFYISNLIIVMLGTFFKEYIFLSNLPILLKSLNELKAGLNKKIKYLLFYLFLNTLFIIFTRKIISYFVNNSLNDKFLYSAPTNLRYLLSSIINFPLGINKLQDILQFMPLVIIVILLLGCFFNNKNNYIFQRRNDIYLIPAFLIFLLLSGAASWSLRVFFPFFIFLLPKACYVLDDIKKNLKL